MSILKIKENYQALLRVKQILSIFFKYGLGDIFNYENLASEMGLDKKNSFSSNQIILKKSLPERLHLAIEELGPAFVKFGQILSTRQDILPEEFLVELAKLQDNVAPASFLEIKKLFKIELGMSFEKAFLSFDKTPLAAASLGQVYQAKLKDGTKVAVKIQRPNIKKNIDLDIVVMEHLSNFLSERFQMINDLYSPKELVDEFAKTLREELNFSSEANNLIRFKSNFVNVENVHVPEIYEDFCTDKIVVMEFIDGVKMSSIIKSRSSKYDKKFLAQIGAQAILKQVFEDAFFHADLHPGNIKVVANNVIVFLDLGMVGRLSESMSSTLADLLIGISQRDAKKIVSSIDSLGIIESASSFDKVRDEIDVLLDKYFGLSLKKIDLSKVVSEILEVMHHNRIKLPTSLVLLMKTLITAEGMALRLDPDFDMVACIQPYAQRMILKKYQPKAILGRAKDNVVKMEQLFEAIPEELLSLLRSFRKNDFNFSLQHKGLDSLISEINSASAKLSFSLITGSLIVGSSLIINSGKQFVILGGIGYVLAGLLGLGLLISIIFKKK